MYIYNSELRSKNVFFNKAEGTYFINNPCQSFNICPYKLFFQPGIYKIELWGAQGGDARFINVPTIDYTSGGRGAYVSGLLSLISPTKLLYWRKWRRSIEYIIICKCWSLLWRI